MFQIEARILGNETRVAGEYTFHKITIRTADGVVHTLDAKEFPWKDYRDKDVAINCSLKWGKYVAGIEAVSID